MAETTSSEAALLAWLRMARLVARTHRDAAAKLKAFDLSNAQFDVIAQVGSHDGPSQQQLAEKLLVTQGNVCQLLDGLQARGLVERRKSGRSNRLYLTEEGRTLYRQAVPAQETWQAGRLAGLEPEEQRQLLRLLRKLEQSQAS